MTCRFCVGYWGKNQESKPPQQKGELELDCMKVEPAYSVQVGRGSQHPTLRRKPSLLQSLKEIIAGRFAFHWRLYHSVFCKGNSQAWFPLESHKGNFEKMLTPTSKGTDLIALGWGKHKYIVLMLTWFYRARIETYGLTGIFHLVWKMASRKPFLSKVFVLRIIFSTVLEI